MICRRNTIHPSAGRIPARSFVARPCRRRPSWRVPARVCLRLEKQRDIYRNALLRLTGEGAARRYGADLLEDKALPTQIPTLDAIEGSKDCWQRHRHSGGGRPVCTVESASVGVAEAAQPALAESFGAIAQQLRGPAIFATKPGQASASAGLAVQVDGADIRRRYARARETKRRFSTRFADRART